MPKIVLNKCYGGFGISLEAALWLFEKGFYDKENNAEYKLTLKKVFKNTKDQDEYINKWEKYQKTGEKDFDLFWAMTPDKEYLLDTTLRNARDDDTLVKCVETLGEKANGKHAKLRIVQIPNNVNWEIDEYDGIESVEEKHQSWG
jgi:hypothetical protein